jgi:hypothetical protein
MLLVMAYLIPRCITKKDVGNFMIISNTLRRNSDFVKKNVKGYCVSQQRSRYNKQYIQE